MEIPHSQNYIITLKLIDQKRSWHIWNARIAFAPCGVSVFDFKQKLAATVGADKREDAIWKPHMT